MVLRFIFTRRFNYFDLFGLVVAIVLRAKDVVGFWGMAGILFAFALASCLGESVTERGAVQ